MSNYANIEDRENLLDTLEDDDKKTEFIYGFMSAITYAYYLSLTDEQRELYTHETTERVIETFGADLLNKFCQEHLNVEK